MSWHYAPGHLSTTDRQEWYVVEYYTRRNGHTGPLTPVGDSKEELIRDLEPMVQDLKTRATVELSVKDL